MADKIRVTIWNEFIHEQSNESVKKMHPEGIHVTLGKGIACDDFDIKYAWLEKDDEHGLSEEVLKETDVLIWWGHIRHHQVKDEIVERVLNHIWAGMGFICLHSGHMSKVFRYLNGTSGKLQWREANERERIWTVNPAHPIAQGLPESFVLEHEEMYGEPFMIAQDAVPVFMSWFEGGNVFRSGVTLQRGNGKVFYFRPGHETLPSYYNENVLKVISNAVRWAAPTIRQDYPTMHRPESLEPISKKDVDVAKAGVVQD